MIESYERINKKLKYALNKCMQYYRQPNGEFEAMLRSQVRGDYILHGANSKNRFIDTRDRLNKIQEQYTSRDYLEGELGTIDDIEQLDGITNIALLALCANRGAKLPEISKTEERKFYSMKNHAIQCLLASIFVLSETSEEYRDFFSYGNRCDLEGKENFTIDLPYFGQISLHYGNTTNKNYIIQGAKKMAASILERKQELGQISKEEVESITIGDDTILPQYTGKLFEYNAGFPLEKESEKELDHFQKVVGIKNKLPEDITKMDIKRIHHASILTDREKNFMIIKLGFSKRQIEELLKWIDPASEINALRVGLEDSPKEHQNEINARELGKKCQDQVSPEQRKMVNSTIERGIENVRSIHKK